MADTQNQIHIKQFKDDIIQAVQQKNNPLDNTIRRQENMKGEEFFFHKLGSVDLLEKTSRNAPTPFIDPSHSRRKMVANSFHAALFIDDFDTDRGIITGLQADYKEALIYGAKRQKADVIIAAATGVAYEGKTGQTAVNFLSAQEVAAGGAGMTANKILDGLEIIQANDVDPDEKIYCVLSPKQHRELLDDNKIISRDFNSLAVLDKGIVGSFANVNFIVSNRLTLTGSDREVLLYTERALGFGMVRDITMKSAENAERSFTNTLYIKLDIGATRVEDEKMVKILCQE